jgi:hypothetical protein
VGQDVEMVQGEEDAAGFLVDGSADEEQRRWEAPAVAARAEGAAARVKLLALGLPATVLEDAGAGRAGVGVRARAVRVEVLVFRDLFRVVAGVPVLGVPVEIGGRN